MRIPYNKFVPYPLEFKINEGLSSDEKKERFYRLSNLYNILYSSTTTYYYKHPVGAGLINLTNNCFLNSIMQCLTHTVVFVQGVLSTRHQPSIHGVGEFCVLCAVRDQIELSFAYSGGQISPKFLVDNLSNISSSFITNQQEDAHEFLQCLLNQLDYNWNMFEASTIGNEPLAEDIFGGSLVSQVQCRNCGHNSETKEALIDLSLEIEDVDSVKNALKSFTKVESIENFKCGNCKEQVQVDKRMLLDKLPVVAALHLKRFKSDGFNVEKIDKIVEYELELDLAPYTKGYTNNENESLKYELYAFVVHAGYSATSGHYYCYIRTSPDQWYIFDDAQIIEVPLKEHEHRMHQQAYILFYARQGTPWFSSMIEQWRRVSFKGLFFGMDIPTTSYPIGTS
ncbi:unnamed protein product [Amaranthus hypochondriacus]